MNYGAIRGALIPPGREHEWNEMMKEQKTDPGQSLVKKPGLVQQLYSQEEMLEELFKYIHMLQDRISPISTYVISPVQEKESHIESCDSPLYNHLAKNNTSIKSIIYRIQAMTDGVQL